MSEEVGTTQPVKVPALNLEKASSGGKGVEKKKSMSKKLKGSIKVREGVVVAGWWW